eukprot:CAMPEP_0115842634 /NCGR_PEP_ID=MMETSP0287-20121206/7901_1 /TAXON_ID=412157 /ORGANISM="Chrysochromulina rotalis, Strain UIO044" /LENGTH=243 /DNA_ID=CAMNT_0003296309 /DNA_START=395 /DNA_END=1129 /DNA_ORIENTATION=+
MKLLSVSSELKSVLGTLCGATSTARGSTFSTRFRGLIVLACGKSDLTYAAPSRCASALTHWPAGVARGAILGALGDAAPAGSLSSIPRGECACVLLSLGAARGHLPPSCRRKEADRGLCNGRGLEGEAAEAGDLRMMGFPALEGGQPLPETDRLNLTPERGWLRRAVVNRLLAAPRLGLQNLLVVHLLLPLQPAHHEFATERRALIGTAGAAALGGGDDEALALAVAAPGLLAVGFWTSAAEE